MLSEMLVRSGKPSARTSALLPLSSNAIRGNIFIFMFAGHEANANTLTFAILLLACSPQIQKAMQKDIDRIVGTVPTDEWSYGRHYALLSEGLVGAVINEALRLYTVLTVIPKWSGEKAQLIKLGNGSYTLPPRTMVLVDTSATHRHPRYWSTPQDEGSQNSFDPLAAFNPYQWLANDLGKSSGPLTPKAGSFVPFSDGHRGCLGRPFALVELCAALTRIFHQHSAELFVRDLVTGASKDEKRTAWESARQKARFELSTGIEFRMSLRMTGTVPFNFVKRGEEVFADLYE